jgi:hypothetical protein
LFLGRNQPKKSSKMQQKNTVKTGGVFHISKGYFGDNFPLQTAKNPPENSVILSPKKRYF